MKTEELWIGFFAVVLAMAGVVGIIVAVARKEPPIGDDPRFVLQVPDGYRCAFSFEEQPALGLCRHLSVSVPTRGRAPSPQAMAVLMAAFGFTDAFCSMLVTLGADVVDPTQAGARGVLGTIWVEEGRAVNAVEKA